MPKVQREVMCVDDVQVSSITTFSMLKDLVAAKKCSAYTVQSSPGWFS